MGNPQYESIESQETHTLINDFRAKDDGILDSSNNHKTRRGLIAIGGLLTICLMALVLGSNNNNPTASKGALLREDNQILADAPIEGATMVVITRACTFDECNTAGCDPSIAPFTCLLHNGGPHGGCSAIPWVEGTCDESCDLSACSDLSIPDSAPSCEGIECDPEWCKGGQVCPPDVSFQCMVGSARFGCSTDKHTWTFKTSEATCSKCCDVTTC